MSWLYSRGLYELNLQIQRSAQNNVFQDSKRKEISNSDSKIGRSNFTSSLKRTSRFCKIRLSQSAIAFACFRNLPVRSCSSVFHSLIIFKRQRKTFEYYITYNMAKNINAYRGQISTSSTVLPVISDGNLGEPATGAATVVLVLLKNKKHITRKHQLQKRKSRWK